MATIAEALAHAMADHRAGRLDQAERVYRQILQVDPNHADAWNLLGVIRCQAGEHRFAADCISRAIRLNPGNAGFRGNLGLTYRAMKKLEEAVACYRRALEMQPDYADTHYNLGNALREQGNLGEAVACYRRALELKPDLAMARTNLGIALQEQGRLGDAVACQRRALELRPHDPETHYNLGNALQAEGKLDEAIACYRRALELKPNLAMAYGNLGDALQAQEKLDEAAACYRRAVELKPDYVNWHINLGIAFQKQGRLSDAVACYRRVLELQPDQDEAYKNLGRALQDQGRLADAIAVWQEWLRNKPGSAIARHLLAANTGQNVPSRATDEYIREEFDQFAEGFDKTLQQLGYRAPDLIATAIGKILGAAQGNLDVLDAGCGTGLCGPLLRPYARRLSGVDLSPAMLERARDRHIYDHLIVAELTAHLGAFAGNYDLVVAADTLVYFGDLQSVLAAAAGALRVGGFLVFTVEKVAVDGPVASGFCLQPHGRYCHREDYLRSTLAEVGLRVLDMTPETLRTEGRQPVHGIVVSSCKTK